MPRRPLPALAAQLLLVAGVLVLPAADGLGARRVPDWSVDGEYLLDMEVGVATIEGRYGYDVGEFNANLLLAFDGPGKLSGGGTAGQVGNFIYTATGTWGIDEATGRTRVSIATPGFTFDGVVAENGLGIDGTHTREIGFGGGTESSSGPLTLGRTPPSSAPDTFVLFMRLAQNKRGRIKAAKVQEAGRARPSEATLQIWGGDALGKGKVKGKMRTDASGVTTGTLRVKGKGWSVEMTGPVDQDGFHAVADVHTPLIDIDDVAVTIPVIPTPDKPPPKPPPPPKNQIDLATAFIQNGRVEIFRGGVSKRFFGAKVDMTIEFPDSVGTGFTVADPLTNGGADGKLFSVVTNKGKVYDTTRIPAAVTIEVLAFTTVRGETIRLRATGKVVAENGKTKNVNVIVLARVL